MTYANYMGYVIAFCGLFQNFGFELSKLKDTLRGGGCGLCTWGSMNYLYTCLYQKHDLITIKAFL